MMDDRFDKVFFLGFLAIGLFGVYYGYNQFVTPYVLKAPEPSVSENRDTDLPESIEWEVKSLPSGYEPILD